MNCSVIVLIEEQERLTVNSLSCYTCETFVDDHCDFAVPNAKFTSCFTPTLPGDFSDPMTTLEWLAYTKSKKNKHTDRFQCYLMVGGYGKIYHGSTSNGICDPNLVDILDDPPRDVEFVVFHETSERSRSYGKVYLTTRQACAVESAALRNPKFDVHLLITSTSIVKNTSDLNDQIIQTLLSYKNIKINRVNVDRYFLGTPLEELYLSGKMNSSIWPTVHLSDVMRFVTMWRYGGIYMDLDMIVLKSLANLGPNFTGLEDKKSVAAGIMRFSKFMLGRFWIESILEYINSYFNPNSWSSNANGVLRLLLEKICNTTDVLEMFRENCYGFEVYPPTMFYPLPYYDSHLLFKSDKLNEVKARMETAKTIHLWNNITGTQIITLGSETPLEYIAKNNCPKVFAQLPPNSSF